MRLADALVLFSFNQQVYSSDYVKLPVRRQLVVMYNRTRRETKQTWTSCVHVGLIGAIRTVIDTITQQQSAGQTASVEARPLTSAAH